MPTIIGICATALFLAVICARLAPYGPPGTPSSSVKKPDPIKVGDFLPDLRTECPDCRKGAVAKRQRAGDDMFGCTTRSHLIHIRACGAVLSGSGKGAVRCRRRAVKRDGQESYLTCEIREGEGRYQHFIKPCPGGGCRLFAYASSSDDPVFICENGHES